jgi:anti-sigma B factor antagonist
VSLTERRAGTPRRMPAKAEYPTRRAFTVDVDTRPGETVLRLHGELDLWTQPEFVAALARVDDDVARIVLDLSGLTFIDAGNIGLIHRSQVRAGLRGTNLVLESPIPNVLRILELTGLCTGATIENEIRPIVLPLPSRAYDRTRGREIQQTTKKWRRT